MSLGKVISSRKSELPIFKAILVLSMLFVVEVFDPAYRHYNTVVRFFGHVTSLFILTAKNKLTIFQIDFHTSNRGASCPIPSIFSNILKCMSLLICFVVFLEDHEVGLFNRLCSFCRKLMARHSSYFGAI